MGTYELVYTGANLVLLIVLMMANFTPLWVLLLINTSLYLGQVVDLELLIRGFANESILTVLFIFPAIIAFVKSMQVTDLMHRIISFGGRHHLAVVSKITVPVYLLSAFVPNTPIVSALYPYVDRWCKSRGMASSKFLIPLSYATILGGVNTVIGTSTNLLSRGIVKQWGIDWNIIATTPMAVLPGTVALLVVVFLSDSLLPANVPTDTDPGETNYKCQIAIPEGSPLIGVRYAERISDHFAHMELYRHPTPPPACSGDRFTVATTTGSPPCEAIGVHPLDGNVRVEAGDVFVACSSPDGLVNFLEEFNGRVITRSLLHFDLSGMVDRLHVMTGTRPDFPSGCKPVFYKVVPSSRNPVINKSVGSNAFESAYQGIVVGISDGSVKVDASTVDVEAAPVPGAGVGAGTGREEREREPEPVPMGLVETSCVTNQTSLLVYATCHFLAKYANSPEFISITRYRGRRLAVHGFDQPLVRSHRNSPYLQLVKRWHLALLLFVASVGLNASGLVDILPLMVLSTLILGTLGVLDCQTVLENCNWEVYLMLVLSGNIGHGLTQSGLDAKIAYLFTYLEGAHTFAVLLLIGLLTVALTAFASNAACVSIMLPVTYQACKQLSLDPSPYLIYVTALASADFMTPFGYQTNLMVQAAGQYRCLDYLKLGSVVTVCYFFLLTGMAYALSR